MGRSLPAALRWKTALRATAPRDHGTPKLTPVFRRGAFSPSQESVTFCAAVEVAGFGAGGWANAEPREPSTSVLVVIAAPASAASFRKSRRLVSAIFVPSHTVYTAIACKC